MEDAEYLVTVDYFSNFAEVDVLRSTSARAVIRAMRSHFAGHGIPQVVVSDNGLQFKAEEFRSFAKEWEFTHATSSPGYPQSNGMA